MPVVEAISVIVHCSAVSRNWGAPLNFWKPSLWGLYAWNLSVEVDSSFQKLRGAPQFLKTSSLRTNAWNFGPFWQGKTPQKPVKKVLWPHDIYKKYLLQKKWVKTAIPALSSGQSNLHQPIWGCHRQLDDQHRNPNNNDRDHLVGQLTKLSLSFQERVYYWIIKLSKEDMNKLRTYFITKIMRKFITGAHKYITFFH